MENYKSWRDEKAKELKSIPDHKERAKVWEKHKKEDVPFLYEYKSEYDTYKPESGLPSIDTLEQNRLGLFYYLPRIESSLESIYDNGELIIDYNSRKQQVAFWEIPNHIGKRFGDAGLIEFEITGVKICLKYYLELLKSKIEPNLDLSENLDEYFDEIVSFDTNSLSKIIQVFLSKSSRYQKIKEIYSKHWKFFREKMDRGEFDLNNKVLATEYNNGVIKMLDEILESDEINFDFDLPTEIKRFKKMVDDLKLKIDKDVSKT
jgi:hypothetical protein